MSEIKCNKLEITSLRQCDSIKIRGNIGPCIIEGPARQDSCQACQPCLSYWIWPVTRTQISRVKITGYIDSLFFYLWVLVRVCAHTNVAAWECACVSAFPTYICVYTQLHTVCTYASPDCAENVQVQDINQVWETVQQWEPQPHLELQKFIGRLLHVLSGAGGKHTNHIIIPSYCCYSKIITNTHIQLCLLFATAYKMCSPGPICVYICVPAYVFAIPGCSVIEALKEPCTLCQVADPVFVNHITHQLQ